MASFDEVALGTYRCVSMENGDAVNTAIGMPPPIQEMMKANLQKMTAATEKDGDGYKFKFSMGPGSPEVTDNFKLGEQFTGKDVLGNTTTNLVWFEDGKAMEERQAPNYKIKMTREFKDGKLFMKTEAGDVEASSIWEKI